MIGGSIARPGGQGNEEEGYMARKRSLLAALVALVGLGFAAIAGPGPAGAQEPFNQLKLSDKMVQSFIAAQKDVADFAQKSPPPASDKPDPKVQAELEKIAKKHGFASFAEFDDVAYNISIVMGGLDPQTGTFTDPITAIKKEIEEITADKAIPEDEKKKMLADLNEALKQTPALKFPENVELVKKYRVDIEKVLQ
jgi:hypothetical protein